MSCQKAAEGLGAWGDLAFFRPNLSGESACSRLLARLDEEAARWPVAPAPEDVFLALRLTPPEAVRVVILGQDPYPTPGDAMGLAFSVRRAERLPASLRNIFKEMKADIGAAPPSGDLSGWAKQGVLLINTALSVRLGEAGSHAAWGWDRLADEALERLGRPGAGRAFVLWGAHAQKRKPMISPEGNLILESAHPSPLSASRGFFGSRPFSRINAFLESRGAAPIGWA